MDHQSAVTNLIFALRAIDWLKPRHIHIPYWTQVREDRDQSADGSIHHRERYLASYLPDFSQPPSRDIRAQQTTSTPSQQAWTQIRFRAQGSPSSALVDMGSRPLPVLRCLPLQRLECTFPHNSRALAVARSRSGHRGTSSPITMPIPSEHAVRSSTRNLR